MGLMEFISTDGIRNTVRNLQAKYIASKPTLNRVKVMECEYVGVSLETAIRNLERFFHVGFQDDHVKSIRELFTKLDLPLPHVEQRVTENYKRTVSKRERQLLAELNTVDIALYKYAKDRYG